VDEDNHKTMEHGGDLHAAKARFPEAPEPWIDLSTGINPTPYPFDPPPLSSYARLPSPGDIRQLERIAAAVYGAPDAAGVVAAAGSQPLIQLLPRLRPTGRIAVVGPTYREHQRCWAAAGHHVAVLPSLQAALASRPDVIVIVNPNNPDGRIVVPDELLQAASELASRDGWLVVDEAFADFEPGVSIAPRLPANGIVLRSLGKAYGLAGLRVGFVVTTPALAAPIRAGTGPWAVSGPAVAIGRAALADDAWRASQASLLKGSAAQLDLILMNAGFTIVGGTRLFRLAWHAQAPQRFEHLARKGIWARQFSDNPKLLRFGNPPADAWKRLLIALRTG
jgi:cobalamin biosynthetic protein CobC